RVFHLDAARLERGAKLVRPLVIAGLARREPFLEQSLVLAVELERRARALLEAEPEHAVHVEEEPKPATAARRIRRVHELQRGFGLRERARSVEVIGDRLGERGADRIAGVGGRRMSTRLKGLADLRSPAVEAALRLAERSPVEV